MVLEKELKEKLLIFRDSKCNQTHICQLSNSNKLFQKTLPPLSPKHAPPSSSVTSAQIDDLKIFAAFDLDI